MINLTVKIEEGRKLLGASRVLSNVTNYRNSFMNISSDQVEEYCNKIRSIIENIPDYSEIKEVSMEPRDYDDCMRKYQAYQEIKEIIKDATNEQILNGSIPRVGKINVVSVNV